MPIQRRLELTYKENFVKFGRMVLKTDRQTDMLIAILSSPPGGEVISPSAQASVQAKPPTTLVVELASFIVSLLCTGCTLETKNSEKLSVRSFCVTFINVFLRRIVTSVSTSQEMQPL